MSVTLPRGKTKDVIKGRRGGEGVSMVRPRTSAPPDWAPPSRSTPLPHTGGFPVKPRSCEPVYSQAAGATIRIRAEVQEEVSIQATYPRHSAPPLLQNTFTLPPCLYTSLSLPSSHPGTPRSSRFPSSCSLRGPAGQEEEGRGRTILPQIGSKPPSPSPSHNIRLRVVPGVAFPGQPNSAGQAPGGSRAC